MDNHTNFSDIENSLTAAMDADEGTGEWVGLLGFSQGAKLTHSILLENQLRFDADPHADGFAGANWKFGIIFAGRAPPYSLSDKTVSNGSFDNPGELPMARYQTPGYAERLRAPTLHVHGLKDQGLELHRELMEEFCVPGSATCWEWDGVHRVPHKTGDVKTVLS